jgi:hypothetical protein
MERQRGDEWHMEYSTSMKMKEESFGDSWGTPQVDNGWGVGRSEDGDVK